MKHEHLSRLARFAGVDVVELTKQFEVHVPLALHAYKSSSISHMVAWKTAIKRPSDRHLKTFKVGEFGARSGRVILCSVHAHDQRPRAEVQQFGKGCMAHGGHRWALTGSGTFWIWSATDPRQEQRALASIFKMA